MPIIRDPYQTFMGQQLDQGLIGNIRDSLTRYMASRNEDIGGNYANDTGGEISHYLSRENRDVYGIDMRDWKLTDTPFFAHPMVIQDKTPMKENSVGGYDNFKIVADMRAVIDKDRTGKLRIINNAAYITLAARAVITQWWLAHGTIGPLRSMPVALPIFTDVIGDMLGSIKMELDDAQRLRVWAGIWYYMAHLEKSLTDLKPDEKFNIIKTLVRDMRVTAEYVEQVLEAAISGYDDKTMKLERTEIGTVKHWFKLAPIACESVRLEGAMKDIGAFFGMIGRAYMDPLKVETMGIAFDHPPTFLALVYSAANDYTPKSSELSKTVHRPIYRDGVEQLTRGITRKLQ